MNPEKPTENIALASHETPYYAGVLSQYLRHTYLDGYHRSTEDKAAIARTVNGILGTIIDNHITEECYLTGSIARCIVGGVPEKFWDYPEYFRSELLQNDEISPQAKTVLETLIKGPADLDTKIKFQNGYNIRDLWTETVRSLGGDPTQATKTVVATVRGIDYAWRSVDLPIDKGDYILRFASGPVPTNVKRHTMNVAILRSDSKEHVFHIDIGEITEDPHATYTDKRLGATSAKQDQCIVNLITKNGEVVFETGQPAHDVMDNPDVIYTESDDPVDLAEIAFRALRTNLLHTTKAEPSIQQFSPYFSSESFFALRAKMQRFIQEGQNLEDKDLSILKKELALCLTVDPYMTIQFLRDSGIAGLIPGLSKVTRQQWDEIILSKHLVLELIGGKYAPKKNERTLIFADRQRKIYRNGNGQPIFNGLERFIWALEEERIIPATENSWEAFMRLWENPAGDNQAPAETYYSYVRNSPAITDAVYTIRQNAGGTNVGILIDRYTLLEQKQLSGLSMTEQELFEMQKIQNRIQSIALICALLRRFPSGLTARELRREYGSVGADFQRVPDFSDIFLDLKLLGLVSMYEVKRLNRRDNIEITNFYSIRPNTILNKIHDLVKNPQFSDFINEHMKIVLDYEKRDNQALFSYETIIDWAREYVNVLGVYTIEALMSMTNRDMDHLIARLPATTVPPSRITLEPKTNIILEAYNQYRNAQ